MFTLTTRSTTISSREVPVDDDNDTTGREIRAQTHLWRWAQIRHDQKYRRHYSRSCGACGALMMAWHGSCCTITMHLHAPAFLLRPSLHLPTLAISKLSSFSFTLGTSDPLLCESVQHTRTCHLSLPPCIIRSHRLAVASGSSSEPYPALRSRRILVPHLLLAPFRDSPSCAPGPRTWQFVFPRDVNET